MLDSTFQFLHTMLSMLHSQNMSSSRKYTQCPPSLYTLTICTSPPRTSSNSSYTRKHRQRTMYYQQHTMNTTMRRRQNMFQQYSSYTKTHLQPNMFQRHSSYTMLPLQLSTYRQHTVYTSV